MSHIGKQGPGRRGPPAWGFTTIELMVVVALLAVLGALALPSFNGAVARYRLMRASEAMVASLYLARSEAIRRGSAQITIERSTPADCPSANTAGRWDCGWNIYLDSNDNSRMDDGELLHASPRFKHVKVQHLSTNSRLKFNRWGDLSALGFGFETEARGQPEQRALCTQGAGRLRIEHDRNKCA